MRRRLLPLVTTAVLATAGCGGDSGEEPPAPRIGSKQAREVAQRVVDRLWRAVTSKDAALPLFYDDRVLEALQPRELTVGLYSSNVQFAVRPRVIAVERTPLGLSVITESEPEGAGRIRASYLLRRVGADWKIVFDSNLAKNVDQLGGTADQLEDPSASQLEAMADADLRLRQAALPRALQGLSRRRTIGPLLRRDYLREASGRPRSGSG